MRMNQAALILMLTGAIQACTFLESDGLYTPLLNDGGSQPPTPGLPDPDALEAESGLSSRATGLPAGTLVENDWQQASRDSQATFSIDVDTASYARTRGLLRSSRLPDAGEVRVEEFLNYFDYKYPGPETGDDGPGLPFAVDFEGAPSPFGEGLHMLRVGLQAGWIENEVRPAANLVFLIDTSGSMDSAEKIGLVQQSLEVLLNELRPDDTVAIVTYAGNSSILLEPTPASNRQQILNAIQNTYIGGSTWGEAGLRDAYSLALQAKVPNGLNRVILCTDGDFNVGVTGEALVNEVALWADRGITLTAMLFGMDGIDDAFLEDLTNRADGNYFHIDTRDEAVRVLSEDIVGTLMVVASDVKLQVELNPEMVERYRIVGYDNRVLADEDFANDAVDAGDLGAGHTVTGLLEVELSDLAGMDSGEQIAEVRVRFRLPGSAQSELATWPLFVSDLAPTIQQASPSMRLAVGVAEFAEILRNSRHSEGARFVEVISLVSADWGADRDVAELVQLIETARNLLPWR
jgi:Ca-activated chloride channel family protein